MTEIMIQIQIKAHPNTPDASSKLGSKSKSMTIKGENVDEAYHRIHILYEQLAAGNANVQYHRRNN